MIIDGKAIEILDLDQDPVAVGYQCRLIGGGKRFAAAIILVFQQSQANLSTAGRRLPALRRRSKRQFAASCVTRAICVNRLPEPLRLAIAFRSGAIQPWQFSSLCRKPLGRDQVDFAGIAANEPMRAPRVVDHREQRIGVARQFMKPMLESSPFGLRHVAAAIIPRIDGHAPPRVPHVNDQWHANAANRQPLAIAVDLFHNRKVQPAT